MSKTAREVMRQAADEDGLIHGDDVESILDAAGFVIVPKEPTKEMLNAGDAGIDSDCRMECSPERVYNR